MIIYEQKNIGGIKTFRSIVRIEIVTLDENSRIDDFRNLEAFLKNIQSGAEKMLFLTVTHKKSTIHYIKTP